MENKNILIINSLSENLDYIFSVFKELKYKGHEPYLMSASKEEKLYLKFKENNLNSKQIYLGPNNIILFALFPFFFFYYIIYLFFLKKSKKINTIFLLGNREKIIFTFLSKMLRLKVFWIRLPGKLCVRKKSVLYRLNLKFVDTIIAFNEFSKDQLMALGTPEDKIKIVHLGIKLDENQIQDNIFNTIAKEEQVKRGCKFFTIGVITELNSEQNIKSLFSAAEQCLKVVPNIQVIVVGDGAERKNFTWMAKTMNLDNLIWFVGHQVNFKKWLHGFDALIVTNSFPKLSDFGVTLNAMQAGIPVIAQRHVGLEEMLGDVHKKLKTLIDIKNSDLIARKIIELNQSVAARTRLGKLSKIKVLEEFRIEITINKIIAMINDSNKNDYKN